jgi:hypothetical protein
MNLVRKLNPFYVSPSPKSFIDRMEKKVFGSNGWIPFLVYLKTLIVIFFFG